VTTRQEHDALVETVASAWRSRDPQGRIQSVAAWHDLDEAGRLEAYEAGCLERLMEAALDVRRLSATAHVVLSRIMGERE